MLKSFPRRSFSEVGLEALAPSVLGRVVSALLGFPVPCGPLGAGGPLTASQDPSPSCLLALHAGGV